jgi:hypothetical protein
LSAEPRTPSAWLRARLRSLRPWQWAAIAVLLVVFLAVSALLARFLSTENVERDDILAVLQAQAKGDAAGMLSKLDGCRSSPSCVATVEADAQRLRRGGAVKILLLKSKTAYALSGSTGKTRVAWTVIGKLPVVQCLQVERKGGFLAGMSVTISSIGPQIPGEGEC